MQGMSFQDASDPTEAAKMGLASSAIESPLRLSVKNCVPSALSILSDSDVLWYPGRFSELIV